MHNTQSESLADDVPGPCPAASLMSVFEPLKWSTCVLWKEDFGVVWAYVPDHVAVGARAIVVYEWSGGVPSDLAVAFSVLRLVTQAEFEAIEAAFHERCRVGVA